MATAWRRHVTPARSAPITARNHCWHAPRHGRRCGLPRRHHHRRPLRARPELTALYEVVRDNLDTLYGAIEDGALDVRIPTHACKGRGFCPSCLGRRMCATAANLVEHVLPEVPLRQWVLTFPFAWRKRLAQDGALLSALTRVFVDTAQSFYTSRAAAQEAKTGAITVVQRTSSDLLYALLGCASPSTKSPNPSAPPRPSPP